MGNCNCEPNTYHLNLGCCVPIVANANAYYTKSEVDEKLEDIVTSGCCITPEEVDEKIESAITDIDLSEYAKKSEIPTVPTNVSAFVNDVPYLTEHQSLSGYATQQWVQNQHYITGVDLSDYATKEYVSEYTYDKETIDEKVAGGGSFDPTQYYNKTQTNDLLDEKLDVTAYTPTDLSNYYNKTEVENIVNSAKTEVEGEIPSLSGYATEQWVLDKHYISGVDLSDYALKSEIPTVPTSNSAFTNDMGYLTEHQSLSAYSTTQEVTNIINQSVSGKQDTLSAGTNITIVGNVISASGGGEIDTYVSGVTRNDSRSIKVDKNGNIRNTIYFSTINGNGIVESSSVVTDIKVPTLSQFSAHTASTTVHVTTSEKNTWNNKVDSSTLNNYLLKSKIWCGTQAAYNSLGTYDPETLYLIHE